MFHKKPKLLRNGFKLKTSFILWVHRMVNYLKRDKKKKKSHLKLCSASSMPFISKIRLFFMGFSVSPEILSFVIFAESNPVVEYFSKNVSSPFNKLIATSRRIAIYMYYSTIILLLIINSQGCAVRVYKMAVVQSIYWVISLLLRNWFSRYNFCYNNPTASNRTFTIISPKLITRKTYNINTNLTVLDGFAQT